MHGATTASSSDCDQVCAGNSLELCGNGNRIQIFQDTSWYVPSTRQLIDALNDYDSALSSARSAMQTYHDHLQQYKNDGGSISGSKSKRDSGGVLTAVLRVDLGYLQTDHSILDKIQATLGKKNSTMW